MFCRYLLSLLVASAFAHRGGHEQEVLMHSIEEVQNAGNTIKEQAMDREMVNNLDSMKAYAIEAMRRVAEGKTEESDGFCGGKLCLGKNKQCSTSAEGKRFCEISDL
mmetsp:Transcript_28172/g.52833  ORF Transcript_28172/g.52833 Transcript_28172/m.52833 type:complete len:107 (-) Transcript_28172:78-398(-)